jgi:hypothetical protein
MDKLTLSEQYDQIKAESQRIMTEGRMYDSETGKWEYFGRVGLFWYIDDTKIFEYRAFELNEEICKPANSTSNFITPNISHPMLWKLETQKKLGTDKSYTYYPRGRANYNVKKNVFELDMDSCIHNESLIMKLCSIFQLERRRVVTNDPSKTNRVSQNASNEGHYTCHLCRGNKKGGIHK